MATPEEIQRLLDRVEELERELEAQRLRDRIRELERGRKPVKWIVPMPPDVMWDKPWRPPGWWGPYCGNVPVLDCRGVAL